MPRPRKELTFEELIQKRDANLNYHKNYNKLCRLNNPKKYELFKNETMKKQYYEANKERLNKQTVE